MCPRPLPEEEAVRTLFASLLLVTVLGGLARAQDLDVKERTLSNGMTVLIVERHEAPVVSFNLKFRVGSADEDSGETGLAHILEHMLFKGTPWTGTKNYAAEKPLLDEIEATYLEFRRKKWELPASLRNDTERFDRLLGLVEGASRPETPEADRAKAAASLAKDAGNLAPQFEGLVALRKKFYSVQQKLETYVQPEEDWKILQNNGARGLNASTGQDTTQYFYSLPSNRIELWALIESNRLRHPVFRQFYKEKEAIMEERRLRVDSNPSGMMWNLLLSGAFRAHSYRWPTIGWTTDIREVSRTEVEQFFRKHYAPNRAVATVVGDVNPDRLVQLMERYFGDIPAQEEPRPVITREPVQEGERRIVYDPKQAVTPRLLIGYHRPAIGHPDFYVLDVITGLLGSGRTSRLMSSIYFGQQLGQVQCGNQDSRFPGLFVFAGQPMPGKSLSALEAGIYHEIDRLKNEPVGAEELQKIKNMNEANFLRAMRDNADLANTLGSYEVLYGWKYVLTYRQRLAAVTPEDIMRVAKKYFTADNRTVVLLDSGKDQ
jgi:predicted Zn-dependent peptidase